MTNYTFSGTTMVFNIKIDHGNIGVETSFVILSCIVFEILSNTCFSVMAALYYVIWELWPRPKLGSNAFL